MRLFGGNQSDSLQRYYPVAPPAVFKALVEIVSQQFKLKTTDDFTLSCAFSSGASAFTWGENFSAQVVPAEGGATVNVQGAGKVGGQIQQSARTNKLVNALFDDVTGVLRATHAPTRSG
jgi:hypothetical protein